MAKLYLALTRFYEKLQPPVVPKGFGVLHPQLDKAVMKITAAFFRKFFAGSHPRRLMLGINPGRFGAGITGINFTAPRQLRDDCGIDNPWGNSSELSAEFIYDMIRAYGGPELFYGDYFIGSVSPLGYVQGGKNMNYYDNARLQKAVMPFIESSLKDLLAMGFERDTCYSIGGEKNYKFLLALNERHRFFRQLVPLPHPRFIMQYRRKRKDEFVKMYLEQLKNQKFKVKT